MTSSKTSSAPQSSQASRSPSRKPGAGGTQPMLPGTGSTITQASSSPQRSITSRTLARSLNGAVSVSAVVAGGTPGEAGMPSVARPEPASTSSASAWPW